MGVYIKGMEMPNKKNGAVLIIYPDGKCAFEDGKTFQAVPVPKHGRLVDLYEIKKRIASCCGDIDCYKSMCYECGVQIVMNKVKDAPIIIPAEEATE